MVAVEACNPSEIFAGLLEMERIPAAYAFHRCQKLGVPNKAAGEMAYTGEKRAKKICVKNLLSYLDLWKSTNVDFHKCEITQMSSSTNVDFDKCGITQFWSCAKDPSNVSG